MFRKILFERVGIGFFLFLIVFLPVVLKAGEDNEIELKIDRYQAGAMNSESIISYRMMEKYADLQVVPFSTLRVRGGLGSTSARLMSIAGKTAPDIMHVMIHQMRQSIGQGFLMPLNDWIGDDENGDGKISGSEVKWKPWEEIPDYYKNVAVVDGKIYGVPYGEVMLGLIVRADLWREEGIDPEKFPEDWDRLFTIFQKLSFPKKDVKGAVLKRGQMALGVQDAFFTHLVWFWAAQASPVQAGKYNPETEKTHWYHYEESEFTDPETGESLVGQPTLWRASFGSEECLKVWDFIYKMRWQPWIRVEDNKPLNLTEEDIAGGHVTDKETGKTYSFTEDDIIRGVVRLFSRTDPISAADAFANGEITALFSGFGSSGGGRLGNINIEPSKISLLPFPPMKKGEKPAIFRTPYYKSLNIDLKDASSEKRKLAWEFLTRAVSPEGRRIEVTEKVLQGFARYITPEDLVDAGFADYVSEVPEHWKKLFRIRKEISHTECYAPGYQQIQNQIAGAQLLGMIYANKDFPYREKAKELEGYANQVIFKDNINKMAASQGNKQKRRWDEYLLVFLIVALILFLSFFGVRKLAKAKLKDSIKRGSSKDVSSLTIPLLMLAPAVLSILIWAYYPLLKGTIIAFQEYKITGESRFIGLDNFREIFTSGKLLFYILLTLKFVVLTLGIGFFAPITLAILLNEIPRFKTFFRTMYYLPRISSVLVIMFIWKLMYNPTEYGTLNRILAFFGLPAQTWLQDPDLAMLCCVIPTVWAAAGAGSLIYLAALKGVPEECYEAADIDGAGFFSKLWNITIPTIKPLIIINFVGAFITAFQGMGNIFVMTGGGPGEATTVFSLAIWYQAFVYLNFGMASAMGWILGIMLISFSLWQLRILNKVEFRKSQTN